MFIFQLDQAISLIVCLHKVRIAESNSLTFEENTVNSYVEEAGVVL